MELGASPEYNGMIRSFMGTPMTPNRLTPHKLCINEQPNRKDLDRLKGTFNLPFADQASESSSEEEINVTTEQLDPLSQSPYYRQVVELVSIVDTILSDTCTIEYGPCLEKFRHDDNHLSTTVKAVMIKISPNPSEEIVASPPRSALRDSLNSLKAKIHEKIHGKKEIYERLIPQLNALSGGRDFSNLFNKPQDEESDGSYWVDINLDLLMGSKQEITKIRVLLSTESERAELEKQFKFDNGEQLEQRKHNLADMYEIYCQFKAWLVSNGKGDSMDDKVEAWPKFIIEHPNHLQTIHRIYGEISADAERDWHSYDFFCSDTGNKYSLLQTTNELAEFFYGLKAAADWCYFAYRKM